MIIMGKKNSKKGLQELFYHSQTPIATTNVLAARAFFGNCINFFSFVDKGGTGQQREIKAMTVDIYADSNNTRFSFSLYLLQTAGNAVTTGDINGHYESEDIIDQVCNDTYGLQLLKANQGTREQRFYTGATVQYVNKTFFRLVMPQDVLQKINEGADRERSAELYLVAVGLTQYQGVNDSIAFNCIYNIHFAEKSRKITPSL